LRSSTPGRGSQVLEGHVHFGLTCWTVIRAAASGSPAHREELARRYLGVVRAYLAARGRGSVRRDDLGGRRAGRVR
jgi:hypothetical protein